MNMPTADCRSRQRAPANIIGSPRRGDPESRDSGIDASPPERRQMAQLAMSLERPSRVIGGVRLAKNVDRIARLQVASGECRIGRKREIADRERADPVK